MRKAIVILCLVLITGDLTKDGETVSSSRKGPLYLWTEKISDQQTQTFRSETVMYQPLT